MNSLTNLENLNVLYNEFENLSDIKIDMRSQLKKLILSSNPFKKFPEEINEMQLDVLEYDNNKLIATKPYTIDNSKIIN